jgi:hypothetical protein
VVNVTFDRWVKALGATPSRRTALGFAAGGVLGGLAGLLGLGDLDARNKKQGKKKGGAKKKKKKKQKGRQPEQGEFCGDRFCAPGKRCCGGQCVDPSECCTSNSDCNACSVCDVSRCVPDPGKNGTKCSGCLECVNGACGVPNDDFCPADHHCRPSTGLCCAKCLDDQCCPAGSACINPGALSANSCCNASLNTACGDNGDGTFRECCSNLSEQCVNGECVPKQDCAGALSAQGVCCPFGPPCNGVCCGENEICGVDGVCENPFVCPRVYCTKRDLVCCPPNSFTNTAYCCPAKSFCENTVVGCSAIE